MKAADATEFLGPQFTGEEDFLTLIKVRVVYHGFLI